MKSHLEPKTNKFLKSENYLMVPRSLTIPASCETSIKKAREAAQMPVTIVLLTGTCVFSLTSEKKDGNSPSLAMAINILGCGRSDPIKVEQRARTAPDVTRYLKQDSAGKKRPQQEAHQVTHSEMEEFSKGLLTSPTAFHASRRQRK